MLEVCNKGNEQRGHAAFWEFLLEILDVWLLRQLPSMDIKKEVTGAAKPVQTRLCGSDGREGAGIPT